MSESKNYIYKLADSYYLLDKRMNIDLAFRCGSFTLSSCCPNIRIPTSRGLPVSLDEHDVIIGVSGGIKTIPLKMMHMVTDILKIRIPTFPTTEGCASYFAEKDDNDEYVHKQYGCIIEDELSGKFRQQKSKSHMAGNIELYSKLYDHRLDDEYLATVNRFPQRPYVSVIGATINHFLPQIPDHFFAQGMAGRFNWVHLPVDEMKFIENEDITDTSNYYKAQEDFQKHIPKLKKLLSKCSDMKNTIKLKMAKEVNQAFMKFDKGLFYDWKHQAITSPFGWDYQYMRRLSEMAIKQAGRFCIGRNFDYIIEHGFDDKVYINSDDMEMGIQAMQVSDKHLQEIFRLRRKGVLESKIYSEVPGYMRKHSPNDLLVVLKEYAPNHTLNNTQWFEQCDVNSPNDFTRFKEQLLKEGKVRKVDKSEITDESERMRLGVNKPAIKIYTIVK